MKNALLSFLVLLVPAVAHADRMRVTSYDMDDGGGTVHVEADAPLGEPWLRVEGRTVKIWFPHVHEVARFDHERGGSEPIHALALRGGASETALLRVELGTGHSITRDDINITRDGLQAAVKLRVPTAQPVVTQPVAAAPVAAPAPPAVAAVPAAPAAPAPVAAAAPQPKAAEPATPAATTGLGAAESSNDEEDLGTQDEEESEHANPIWLLGAASVLLAFVYFGLQHLQRTRRTNSPSIEVVGSRKIGPRQELVIVRALGSDHLLLCTNGRAERVASTPTNLALPANTTAAQPAADAKTHGQAGGIGLMSRLSSQHRLRKLLDSVGDVSPAGDGDGDEGDSAAPSDSEFNTELRTATRQRSALLHSIPAPAARQSESVAGITRLRQRR